MSRAPLAFVQARMSSRRFPGKILAPFGGIPVISHVLAEVGRCVPRTRTVLLTSVEASDDPLACFVRDKGYAVFRGALDDVFGRFQACLRAHPCDWFFRICADSPMLDGSLLRRFLARVGRGVDLVTNVFPRTFPRGRSVELVRSSTFTALRGADLTSEQREHVTRVFYDRPEDFRIVNIRSSDPSATRLQLCVDTVEDLRRLEGGLGNGVQVGSRHAD